MGHVSSASRVGPFGHAEVPTNNRAELRAVVAALGFMLTEGRGNGRPAAFGTWVDKDISKLVIATDSTYVANGATKWARNWERNGWRHVDDHPVRSRDLWELLLERVRVLQCRRCAKVSFWRVSRKYNLADDAAKYAATLPARQL